jgi:hypothetical protein
VLAGNADGVNAAPVPVSVAVVVVSLAGLGVVAGAVDLDYHGAAVADHGEVRGAHAGVAELGSRQRQHGEGVLGPGLPLEVDEDLVDGKLGLAAEDEAVLGGITLFSTLAPRLIAGCLFGRLGCLVTPAGCDGGQPRAACSITKD